MTADTALRLGQYFGMSADFWMNLQSAYELDLARQQNGKAIQRIPSAAIRRSRGFPQRNNRTAFSRSVIVIYCGRLTCRHVAFSFPESSAL